MTSRRAFLKALIATAGMPAMGWADAGSPAFLGAAREPDGRYVLFGIRTDGSVAFRVPLPDRGHAAAAHPTAPEAVAFARRPGHYALVIDCATGAVLHRLTAPKGHHFYGHGVFLGDQDTMLTTENHFDSGMGRIGIWSRGRGYARIGQIDSGGIGPHDILRLRGTDILAVANGGIRTHPDTGREKLNLDSMCPNLTILTADGQVLDRAELPAEFHQNSLRHLAVAPDGAVACAFQWEGDAAEAPPLLANYRRGRPLTIADVPETRLRAMHGYAGSVAMSSDGTRIAITSPRGGVIQTYDNNGKFLSQQNRADVCGVAPMGQGILASDGLGGLQKVTDTGLEHLARHDVAWDNHLVALPAASGP